MTIQGISKKCEISWQRVLVLYVEGSCCKKFKIRRQWMIFEKSKNVREKNKKYFKGDTIHEKA